MLLYFRSERAPDEEDDDDEEEILGSDDDEQEAPSDYVKGNMTPWYETLQNLHP